MNKWAVVALLWFVCFFNYADRQAIYSVFPLLKTEMGLTDVQLGIVGASFMWVYAAAAPLAGIVGDRFARCETRFRAMAIHQSSVHAGTITGGPVGGVMGQTLGWRSSFYLFDQQHGVPADRVGVMNSAGWVGGGFAPIAIPMRRSATA